MPRFSSIVIILIVLPVILAGCEGESGPEGPAGPALTGTLNGSVTLFLENGAQETNHSGVSVWIEGGTDTTLTDSLGRWTLPASTGIHTIMMQKAGYGYTKIPQVQFVGGGDLELGNRYLSRPPTFSVTNAGITFFIAPQTMVISGYISPPASSDRSVVIFIGRQPILRTDPRTYIDRFVVVAFANTGVGNSPSFPIHNPPYNFATNDSIYYLIVPGSVTWGGFIDPVSEQMIFTTGFADTGYSGFTLAQ